MRYSSLKAEEDKQRVFDTIGDEELKIQRKKMESQLQIQ